MPFRPTLPLSPTSVSTTQSTITSLTMAPSSSTLPSQTATLKSSHDKNSVEQQSTESANSPTAALLAIQQNIDQTLKQNLTQHSSYYYSSPSSSSQFLYQLGDNNPLLELYERRRHVIHSVPGFWLSVLLAHPAFSFFITATDTRIMQFCDNINVHIISPDSFEIVFSFQKNPYLSNQSITKKYTMSDTSGRVVHPGNVSWASPAKSQINSSQLADGSKHLTKMNDYNEYDEDDNSVDEDISFGLMHWLTFDQCDSNQFGELIRDEIYPNAIDIYFGTYQSSRSSSDNLDI